MPSMRSQQPELASCGLYSHDERETISASSTPEIHQRARIRLPSSLCKPSLRTYFDWDDSGNDDYAKRPALLDLFAGGGGAAMGYYLAGFRVVGIDNRPQPHFPFEFHQADALTYPLEGFDAYHASPPCQGFSVMTKRWGRSEEHPDLIVSVRDKLEEIGKPFVIENVIGAPLHNPLMLCGSMFGLGANPEYHCDCGGFPFEYDSGKYGCPNCLGEGNAVLKYKYQLRRHRLFECSWGIIFPPTSCNHQGLSLPVFGHAGGQSNRDGLKFPGTDAWREGMGIDWMVGKELAQAIPPAFTEYIGKFLMKAVIEVKK